MCGFYMNSWKDLKPNRVRNFAKKTANVFLKKISNFSLPKLFESLEQLIQLSRGPGIGKERHHHSISKPGKYVTVHLA
jgi:hypothetical protein